MSKFYKSIQLIVLGVILIAIGAIELYLSNLNKFVSISGKLIENIPLWVDIFFMFFGSVFIIWGIILIIINNKNHDDLI